MGNCTVDWSSVNVAMDQRDSSTANEAKAYAQNQASGVRNSLEGLDHRLEALFEIVRNCSPRADTEGEFHSRGNDHTWSQSTGTMDAKDRGWEKSTKQYADSVFSDIEPIVTELRGSVNALYRIIHFSNVSSVAGNNAKGGGDDHNWSQETGEMENKDRATLDRVKQYVDSKERELSTEVAKIISKIEGMEDITSGWCETETDKA